MNSWMQTVLRIWRFWRSSDVAAPLFLASRQGASAEAVCENALQDGGLSRNKDRFHAGGILTGRLPGGIPVNPGEVKQWTHLPDCFYIVAHYDREIKLIYMQYNNKLCVRIEAVY